MSEATAARNQQIAYKLSNNLPRLLREFYKDYERRIFVGIQQRGHASVRPAHSAVFANLGMGAVRVTELAKRAQVTQQAMGKMLKELERMGYVTRDIDVLDKRAKEIKLTERGIQLAQDSLEVVEDVRDFYQNRVGAEKLGHLEHTLREVIDQIGLEYLPESWAREEPDNAK